MRMSPCTVKSMSWLNDAAWIAAIASLIAALISLSGGVFSFFWTWMRRPKAHLVLDGTIRINPEKLRGLFNAPNTPNPDLVIHFVNSGDGAVYMLEYFPFFKCKALFFRPYSHSSTGITPAVLPAVRPGDEIGLAVWLDNPDEIEFPLSGLLIWKDPPVRSRGHLAQGVHFHLENVPYVFPPLRLERYRRRRKFLSPVVEMCPFPRPPWWMVLQKREWRKNPFEFAQKRFGFPWLVVDPSRMSEDQRASSFFHAFAPERKQQPASRSERPSTSRGRKRRRRSRAKRTRKK